MRHRLMGLVLVAGAALAISAAVATGKTQVFLETSEDQFSQGHAEGIVWTSLGTLRLGRALDDLLTQTEGVDYVAHLAEAADGTVYAVTGGAGRIYRLKDKKADLFATLPDKFLFSCIVAKGGELYVGSGGAKGRIWRITPQAKGEPKAEVFFEADDVKYVWDLAWMKDGALAAATGDKGKLLRITPDKKSEVLINSENNHVLCVLAAPDGTLYAGTDGEAVVYRWADKKSFIFYDAEEAEVTSLALDPAGNLYVGTSGGGAGRAGGVEIPSEPPARISVPSPAPPTGGPFSTAEPKDAAKETPKEAPKDTSAPPAETPRPDEGAGKPPEPAPASAAQALAAKLSESLQAARPSAAKRPGMGAPAPAAAVYRITPEGIATRVFEPRDAMVLALAVSGGRLLVGTGKSARVHEVGCQTDEEQACVASIDPKQVMALLVTRDGRVVVGSAGPGRIYTLSNGHAKEGTYTSQAYDAGGSAHWGALEWRGQTPDGTEVRIATRTGNVRDPDKGMWSDWSKGAAKSPARVESPPARFIQFRVTMRGRGDGVTPVLEQYEAAYLRVNEPPKILSIGEAPTPDQAARAQAIERFRQATKPKPRPAGQLPQQPPPPTPPPPEGAQPVRMIQWQAQDPNQDTLRFSISFRGQGEPNWIPLDTDLSQPQYAWDTSTVADGWYEIKVVASDRADNPPETALEAEKVSDPILVDNTAPVIENLRVQIHPGGEVEVRFTARDATSRLTEAAYTIDSATDWRTLAPADGLFDGRQKEFRFTIHKLVPGPHRLAVRTTDEAQNVGHAAQTIAVGK